MASIADILNIKNLFLLDAEALADQRVLDKLSELAQDAEFDLEPGRAMEFYDQLDKLVKDNQGQVEANPIIYNQLMAVLWVLSWKAMPAMSLKQSKNILSENLVDSIKLGVNVSECLKKILGIYEFRVGPDKETRRGWIYSLENNQEKLGDKPLSLDVGAVQPTIQNWLKSYNTNQPLTVNRDKFNQINFFNNNRQASQLNNTDKEVLKQILEIYDWLLFPPPGPAVIPEEPGEQTKTTGGLPYMQSQKFQLSSNELPRPITNQQPPAVPVPKNASENRKVGMSDVGISEGRKSEIGRSEGIFNNPITSPSPSLERRGMGAGLQKPVFAEENRMDKTDWTDRTGIGVMPSRVNIQNILKNRDRSEETTAGLKMGEGVEKIPNNKFPRPQSPSAPAVGGQAISNENVEGKNPSSFVLNPLLEKKPAPQNIQSKQQEIDRKLEELRKKTQDGIKS